MARIFFVPLIALLACDSLDVGHNPEPEGGPILQRIVLQDEDVYDGRYLYTDLLDGQSLLATPPAIGTPIEHGGNQLRLVFDRLLDPTVEAANVRWFDAQGAEVAALAHYDPSGVFSESSDPISTPYGPALVLKNELPLSASTTYTITFDASSIRDRQGDVLERDLHGPIAENYRFTTEPLYALEGMITPDFSGDDMVISPDDHFRIETNADIELGAMNVEVLASSGEVVHASLAIDCEAGPRVLNIVHTSSTGAAAPWPKGSYTISVSSIARDVTGTPLSGSFTVE